MQEQGVEFSNGNLCYVIELFDLFRCPLARPFRCEGVTISRIEAFLETAKAIIFGPRAQTELTAGVTAERADGEIFVDCQGVIQPSGDLHNRGALDGAHNFSLQGPLELNMSRNSPNILKESESGLNMQQS